MQLKIISFNIWDLNLWFVKNRVERITKVAQYLANSGADILCVQEAWTNSTRPLIYKILGEAGYSYASVSEAPLILGNSGLVTFSKFPIKKKKFTAFTRLSSAFVELFTAKGVLETVVETPYGDLTVFNTHLHMPSWFLGQRVRLHQMKRVLKAINGSDGPAVLAGDFNEDKIWEQKEFTNILSAANFSNPLTVESGMPSTYRLENEFVDIWMNRDYAGQRFDYIFIRSIDKLGLKVSSYEPLYLKPALSDHDPVEVVLSNN